MNKLGIIADLINSWAKITPVLKLLGPDRATIYFRASKLAANNPDLDQLKALGLEIAAIDDGDDEFKGPCAAHDTFYADSSFLYPDCGSGLNANTTARYRQSRNAAHWLLARGKRVICDAYSLELEPGEHGLVPGVFFLSACEELMFRSVGRGEIWCDADGRAEMGISPQGGEVAAAGLPNVTEEFLVLAHKEKKDLKKELADRMGVRFNPSLPLVVYLTTLGNELADMDRGLKRLAGKANLIVKVRPSEYEGPDNGFNAACGISGENIFLTTGAFTDSLSDLNWLLRYAADLTLTNPWGGGFYTNFLLGLRMIIIFTNRMLCGLSPGGLTAPANFTSIMRDTRYLWVKAAYGLCPINVESTDMIINRIHDHDYWQRYDREIGRLADGVMGRTWLGHEAAQRAAMFIKRVMSRGTLKPDPEEMPGARIIKGPVSYEFPTNICL